MNLVIDQIHPASVVCLDAEFAEGKEMLELSVCDMLGNPLYNQRFRPATLTRWMLVPHNISPEMVAREPRFKKCIPDIRGILDKADYILGFALENDIKMLRREGVVIPDSKIILELRDWFWILYGLGHGLDYSTGISNQSVADHLGIPVNEDALHTSDYDTRLTSASFRRLIELSEPVLGKHDSLRSLYTAFKKKFDVEKEAYDRRLAGGYCYIIKREGDYLLKATMLDPADDPAIIAKVKVENRKEAMIHFSNLFLGKILEGNLRLSHVSKVKLEKFRNYSDTYSADSKDMAAKLMRLAKKYR